MKLLYVAGWSYVAVALATLYGSNRVANLPPEPLVYPLPVAQPAGQPVVQPVQSWFERVRPHCNPVEVEVTLRGNPAPADLNGQAWAAACYALAGKISQASAYIDRLDESQRAQAANVVFNAAHPVADAGDDEATGPIMELVVKYIPNHYMALYHAGIAQFRTNQPAAAKRNLEEFLKHYNANDGWTNNARATLKQIADGGEL